MTQTATKLRDRADRKSHRRQAKKDQIASSAIGALRTLGYANTTLRDIAAGSGLSLGMLHYYFEDKTALITYCVRVYKAQFVADLQARLTAANGRDEILRDMSAGLAHAVAEDWETHRLWYDIRTQAMFDEAFQPTVAEIEQALAGLMEKVADLLEVETDTMAVYAAIDGLFRYFIQCASRGEMPPTDNMADAFHDAMNALFAG